MSAPKRRAAGITTLPDFFWHPYENVACAHWSHSPLPLESIERPVARLYATEGKTLTALCDSCAMLWKRGAVEPMARLGERIEFERGGAS